ncbi:hypothetical protein IEQ34_013376 [Dendrobium chrysotoxum]|uniref:Uncharacterized protein n=1 Tax=Dendrobium chrysotoxum TaxID=161865 RepID=A0AAV7GPK9_DENCH|nr:hypothetical protein IEQ34_013376 [Dendrobium chrysotoxum]
MCWVENRLMLNCIVIPTSSRRTSNGLTSMLGELMRSIHGFERVRLQQVKVLLLDQQTILTTTLGRKR